MIRAGISGCVGTSLLLPLDVLVVKLSGGKKPITFIEAVKSIYSQRGLKGFWAGYDAALVRQFSFSSIRVGLFFNIVEYANKKLNRNLKTYEKTLASATVGAFASIVINPFDIAMVRMMLDLTLPPNERRGYSNVFNALFRIAKEEGPSTLLRGAFPNMLKGIGLNVGQMVPYQESKERLKKYFGESYKTEIICSIIGGICGSICALPFHNIKIKLVNMKPDANGVMPYKGVGDCLKKTIASEGIGKLWTGFIPYTCNLAPLSIITLMTSTFIKEKLNF